MPPDVPSPYELPYGHPLRRDEAEDIELATEAIMSRYPSLAGRRSEVMDWVTIALHAVGQR